MLATVPIGLYPSSPGYSMAQTMSSMVKQKIILKGGIKLPRSTAKKQETESKQTSITRDTITLNTDSSSNHKCNNTIASTTNVTLSPTLDDASKKNSTYTYITTRTGINSEKYK